MGEDNNDKKTNAPTPPTGEPNKGRGGCRGGQNRQRWNNNSAIGSTGKFKGKTPGIKHDIFDNIPNLVTVSPMLNARSVANLATSPSIAQRKKERLLQYRSML